MERYEYIRWYLKYIDDETPLLLFYQIDLSNERYAVRMAEVYCDRTVLRVTEEGYDFITEAPVPTTDEINKDPDFFAEIISVEEFERVYQSDIYTDSIFHDQ